MKRSRVPVIACVASNKATTSINTCSQRDSHQAFKIKQEQRAHLFTITLTKTLIRTEDKREIAISIGFKDFHNQFAIRHFKGHQLQIPSIVKGSLRQSEPKLGLPPTPAQETEYF